MTSDDRRAQRAGALALAAAALGAIALVLLDGVDLRPVVRVEIDMEHAGSLVEGEPVIVAGREIGRVERISLAPAGAPGDGRDGVTLRVAIQRRYASRLSIHSEFFVEQRGAFGRPYLAAMPPPEPIDFERGLADGDRLRGVDPALVDRVLRRLTANAIELRLLVAAAEPALDELRRELGLAAAAWRDAEPEPGAASRAAESLASAARELDALAAQLSAAPAPELEAVHRVLGRVSAELDRARAEISAFEPAIERLQPLSGAGEMLEETAARARDSIGQLAHVAARASELAARVDAGRGTLGAILNDPAFSQDARRVGRELMRRPWRVLGRPPER